MGHSETTANAAHAGMRPMFCTRTHACFYRKQTMTERTETYWLKANGIPGSTWQKVSKEHWIKAERQAGFRPKLWSGDPNYMKVCATAGFGNGQISGSITIDGKPPQH